MTQTGVPTRSNDVVTRKLGGEMVLVPVRSNVGDLDHVYTLSAVGCFIWEHLDGKRGLEELRDEIVGEFDVEPKVAGADLKEFLEDLERAGLISPGGDE